MIAPQSFETYDIFGSGATKVEPPAAKRSAGWQQADVLPAEYMNWAWYKNSKCITDLNAGVKSVEDEIKTVLDNANISPDASATNQLFTAIQKNTGCIITDALTPTTITNAPALQTGSVIKVMFGADVTGANTSTALTISYNGSAKTVKVNKNGTLEDFKATEIATSTYKYIQGNSIIDFVYDGTYFVIIGNPVVLSDTSYTVYANGKKAVDDAYPVNSIYVQYPSQSKPADLFGLTTWTDVSSSYAGAFFRANGGNSATFGTKQSEGLPDICGTFGVQAGNTTGRYYPLAPYTESGAFVSNNSGTVANIDSYSAGGMTTGNRGFEFKASYYNSIYGRDTHVTPENYSIKIWKRTA